MFELRDDGLYHDARRLGPRHALYVDSGELTTLGREQGVAHLAMPAHIDFVFVAGSRIVGCESKRPDDLVSSTHAKRLARQMRVLLREVNVPALVLRGGLPFADAETLENLVWLQALGVMLLPTGARDTDVLEALSTYAPILADGSRSALAAVAGTDKGKPRSVLGAVKGVGPAREALLRTKFGSTRAVFAASKDELRAAGLSKGLVERIRLAGE